ncbi:Crp/Fnr family transcriptional regulator [Parachitinimonas caeni]|uniref:Crp/Fnr family transcriptional regulator n=1 Tax=Parachitinimonas caeni TaxID=3031301 RepID=A0ABT7E2Y8_9NEIS|nr:Crp/Fnr family transcriptional regulator [Parachitinimonas caeni]MDK2125678.1 Crp/Fnr family transcriptional regulator [Parachitinimonas caeni]
MGRKLDIGELLRQQPVFREMSDELLQRLAAVAIQVRAAKHQLVFRRGEQATGIYIVATGHVKLAIPSPQGQEKVIEFFRPGQIFGDAVMFLDRPYLVDAEALEDSLLIWIDKHHLYEAIDHEPALARHLLVSLSQRLHFLMQDIESVNLQTSTQRVVSWLLRQPRRATDAGTQTSFAVSKNLIASKLGLTPETLSRVLHQLRIAGLIQVEGRDILIHDADALEQCMAG